MDKIDKNDWKKQRHSSDSINHWNESEINKKIEKNSTNFTPLRYKRVYCVQDDSGHWYIIPYELKDKFFKMEQEANKTEEYNEFIKEFEQYMTGGDLNLIELYTKI